MRRWIAGLFLISSCSSTHYVDFPDKDLTKPSASELEERRIRYREGTERYHGDPKEVAHIALDYNEDVPWRGRPYRPQDYQFHESNSDHPDWGCYVVRGWVEESGRVRRYRVKVRSYKEIWYAVQVSHFIALELTDERLEGGSTPPDAKH